MINLLGLNQITYIMKKQLLFTTALILFSAMNFGQIPTNGLLLYYKFNGDLKDTSGNNRDATANGIATYMEDFEGNANSAIDFGNALKYITGSNTSNLPMGGGDDWTISFYYNLNNSSGGNTLFEKKTRSSKTLQYSFHVGTNLTTGIDSYIQGGWAGSLTSYPLSTVDGK